VVELFFVRQRVEHRRRIVETECVAGLGDARDVVARRRDARFGLFDQKRTESKADRKRADCDDDDDEQSVGRGNARPQRYVNL
jgi:hypothetical protein